MGRTFRTFHSDFLDRGLVVQDEDVPYETSLLLMERLVTDDVDIVYRKTGNHRLMTHSDLILLLSELERMLKQYPVEQKPAQLEVAKSKL